MRIFLHTFLTTLRAGAAPFAVAMVACTACVLLAPQPEGTGVDRTTGHWLHLPGLLLVAATLIAALEAWPLFSRGRPGFGWVHRVQNRPLHGCAVAALGSLSALVVSLVAAGCAFAVLSTTAGIDRGEVEDRIPVTAADDTHRLDDRRHRIRFDPTEDTPIRRVRLRPAGIVGSDESPQQIASNGVDAADIRITADGVPLHPGYLQNAGDPIDLSIDPPRRIATLQIERRPRKGTALGLFPETVELVAATYHSPTANCLLAILSYLAPAVLGFAVMILGHAHLALPVNFAAGLVTCLLATLLEVTPTTAAITACARGQWLLGGHLTTPLGEGLLVAGTFWLGSVGTVWLLGTWARRRVA